MKIVGSAYPTQQPTSDPTADPTSSAPTTGVPSTGQPSITPTTAARTSETLSPSIAPSQPPLPTISVLNPALTNQIVKSLMIHLIDFDPCVVILM